MKGLRHRVLVPALLALALVHPVAVAAQGQIPARASTTLFVLDLAGTPVGEIPAAIRQLSGIMEVVLKDGVPMLKASARSEFLITLPQVLPADFTLEFDLVPKACCNPQDLSFEGTPVINQGGGSAHVLWDSDGYLAVIGGGAMYESPMPEELRTTLPGVLTTVVAVFQGNTIRLYTNGRRHYTLSDRPFARGRVLRVFLGGQDDGANAVHLARLRISAGALPPTMVASSPTPPPGQPGPAGSPPATQPPIPPPPGQPGQQSGTASQSQASTGGPIATVVTNVSVTQGAAGPVVSWLGSAAPAVYTVRRWKIDDPICCNTASALNPALTGPPWQDAPPPLSGTYVYEVTARTNAGIASAQGQFVYQRTGGGQIVGPAGITTPTPVSTTPAPTVPAPIAAAAGAVPSAFTVTVTLGGRGPLVTWPSVPTATGYSVSRWKADDLNCCNTSSGRMWAAASPWQDSPLPMSGTYEYLVLASTPAGVLRGVAQFGFRMPGGAPTAPAPTPVVAQPATSPSGTITPMPPPTPAPQPAPAPSTGGTILTPTRPSGTAAVGNTGPAPEQLGVDGTPIIARVRWYQPNSTNLLPNSGITYRVSRAVAGSTNFTVLTPTPLTVQYLEDILPDRSVTYTFAVTALHPDGTQGTATADFTAPPPADPTNFVATVKGVDEVELSWSTSPGPAEYFVTGPGTGSGVIVAGTPITLPGQQQRLSHFIKGLPPGTHTWKIASSYLPGGILTQPSQWSTATATMAAVGKYEISIESVKVNSPAVDDLFHGDGLQNEFYVTAFVRTTDKSGKLLSETSHKSVTHGDITNWPPPARIKAGSAGPAGGVWAADLISPIWDQPNAASQGWTRFVLWSGTLTAGMETVDVAPVIWESDNDPAVSDRYVGYLKQIGYYVLDLNTRTATGDISNVMLPDEQKIATNGVTRGSFLPFMLLTPMDRPIGIGRDAPDPLDDAALWYMIAIRLNQTVAEAALSGAYGPPGLIPIRFVDHKLMSKDTFTHPDLGMGDYVLNIRITRLP